MDAAFSQYRIAPDVTVEPVTANGVRAEWTSTPQDDRDAALLWLHGGGYVLGSLDSHRHVVSEAGRAAKAWSLALDYRLAGVPPASRFARTADSALPRRQTRSSCAAVRSIHRNY